MKSENALDIVKYLHQNGADIHARNNHTHGQAVDEKQIPVIKYLHDNGVQMPHLDEELQKKVKLYGEACQRWQAAVGLDPPYGLEREEPVPYRRECYAYLFRMLTKELSWDGISKRIALQGAALFETTDRAVRYVQKWGRDCKQPVHDVLYMINVKQGGNLRLWSDAVMACGPSMASMTRFMDKVPVPERSDDGKTWSYVKTREVVAKIAFANAARNPKLAELCFEVNGSERAFEKALLLQPSQKKNIPDITIPGEKFDMPGTVFRKLANDDIRGLFLGEMSGCCQSLGSVGEECAINGFTSEDSGFYVIEKNNRKIVGQVWAWRGTQGELCFDSLENRLGSVNAKSWLKILQETAHELTEKKAVHDVTMLAVGLEGNTPEGIKTAFNTRTKAQPKIYNGYRDSKEAQALVWKR